MIYQKVRPKRFDDIVGQQMTVESLRTQSMNDTWFQVYLLEGQFGSGKTTLARIIAMAANCPCKDERGNPCGRCGACREVLSGSSPDVIEIDGASNNGVDSIRELKEMVGYFPQSLKKKIYIIDEVHMLTPQAWNALLKVLEEPPSHVIFVLATTDTRRIPDTILSRTARYSFGRISPEMMAEHIVKTAERESIPITLSAAMLIAKYSEGSLRNAVKNLEILSYSGKKITDDLVFGLFGISNQTELFSVIDSLLSCDCERFILNVKSYEKRGKNFSRLLEELLDLATDLMISSCGGEVNATGLYRELLEKNKGMYGIRTLSLLSSSLISLIKDAGSNMSPVFFIAAGMSIINTFMKERGTSISCGRSEKKPEPVKTALPCDFGFAPVKESPFDGDRKESERDIEPEKCDENEVPIDDADSGFDFFDKMFQLSEAQFDSYLSDKVPSEGETENPNITGEPNGENSPEEPDIPELLAYADLSGLTNEAVNELHELCTACKIDKELSGILSDGFEVYSENGRLVISARSNEELLDLMDKLSEKDFHEILFRSK